ncbi:SET [Micropterus dolomieu adomavirus 1]|uniref:SET n=1 Tax=Micropterus dolomieu adomavirus 1 TaxID=2744370 RepID=A0AAE8YGZ7_9VIRU|nr:SET [Micropterus dolomieu adomavirus 1]
MHSVLDSLSDRTWTENTLFISGALTAAKDIPKHALACVFEGEIHAHDSGRDVVVTERSHILYFTGHKGERLLCDPSGSATHGHRVAHSPTPNLYLDLYRCDCVYRIALIAKSHIKKGEPLTLDFQPKHRIDVPFKGYSMVSSLILQCLYV